MVDSGAVILRIAEIRELLTQIENWLDDQNLITKTPKERLSKIKQKLDDIYNLTLAS